LVLAVLLVPALLAGCKVPGPHLIVPTPPSSRYVALDATAIHALSTTHIWVAGDLITTGGAPEGLILWSTDAGKRGHRAGFEIHDLSNVTFTDIYFTDRMRGWVAGRRVTAEGVHRAIVFWTLDGGNHWFEVTLPAADQVAIEDVHSVGFKSDTEGQLVVSYRDAKTSTVTETVYQTNDGGRTWAVSTFAQPPKAKTDDRAVSWFNVAKTNGFRLRRSERPGVTVLEETASGGKDWMPVSELSVSYIPSFY
jgi:photosystem II stability/assembly factor-like uncharacterized protein